MIFDWIFSKPIFTLLYWNYFCFLILDHPGSLKVEIFLGRETIQVEKTNEIFEFKRDTILSISCKVTSDKDLGNPKGTVQWFYGSSDIAIEKNVNVSARLERLHFQGLKKEDNGSYICRIENIVERQAQSIQLVVLGEVSYISYLFKSVPLNLVSNFKWI